MAGLGETCSHVAALLFSIDGTVKIRDSRTVNQEPAYWLLPASIKTASYRETRSIDFSAAKMMKKRFDQQINTPMSATPSSGPDGGNKNRLCRLHCMDGCRHAHRANPFEHRII